jgi:hypothetical protein
VIILHRIIYDGRTWEDLKTNPDEILKTFNFAWYAYNAPCMNEDIQFSQWVFQDMKAHIVQAEKICSYARVDASEVEETEAVIIPFRKAA